jgi:predicted DNA-binding transcriptional regulator AlpA
MSAKRALAELPDWPALLGAEQAAAYCGISRRSFESLVKSGSLPKAVKLPLRRKLWHRASLDSVLGKGGADDWQSREAAWRKRHEDRSPHAR